MIFSQLCFFIPPPCYNIFDIFHHKSLVIFSEHLYYETFLNTVILNICYFFYIQFGCFYIITLLYLCYWHLFLLILVIFHFVYIKPLLLQIKLQLCDQVLDFKLWKKDKNKTCIEFETQIIPIKFSSQLYSQTFTNIMQKFIKYTK